MDSPAAQDDKDEGGDKPEKVPLLNRWADQFLQHFWQWGLTLLLVGGAPGLAIWPLLHHDELEFISTGKLDIDLRIQMLAYIVASIAIIVALYIVAFALLRRKARRLSFADTATRLNRYTFVVIPTPLITALMQRGIETSHQFVTLTLIGACTVFFGIFIYRVLDRRPDLPADLEVVKRKWLPPLIAGLLFVAYSTYVSYLTLLDHSNLGTHVYDLGIYDNIFWHNANGDFMGCSYCKTGKHMSSHFDPIIWVLSPIYKLYPRAETVLVLQTVWLASAMAPLYLLAKRRLKNPWFGVLLCAIYAFYPALHGANMFDFHSLTMCVPSLVWCIYLIDAGKLGPYWFALGFLLVTREDMALLACFIGAYAFLQRRPITGILTVLISLAYLALIKLFVMNDPGLIMSGGKEATSFHYFYDEMIPHKEEGMKGLVISFITNPVYALQVVFKEGKLFYFLALLMPLLFLPVIAGRKTVMMIYGLVFIGLASRRHVFSLHFQYSSVLFPVLMAAFPDAVDRASRTRIAKALGLRQRRLVWTLFWTALFCTVLLNHKYGVMWANDSFKAGWNRLNRMPGEAKKKRYKYVRGLIDDNIPADAAVCSSSSLGPQISNRDRATKWPAYRTADYLLLGTDGMKKKGERRLDRLLRRGLFREIDSKHGISLFEKVPEEERDEERKKQRARPPVKGKKRGGPKKGGKSADPPDGPKDDPRDAELEEDGDDDAEVENPHFSEVEEKKPEKPKRPDDDLNQPDDARRGPADPDDDGPDEPEEPGDDARADPDDEGGGAQR